jgi:hypothetical protein
MVNFTAEQFRELMNHPTNIRNMSVIAHVVRIAYKCVFDGLGSRKDNFDGFSFEESWNRICWPETGAGYASR